MQLQLASASVQSLAAINKLSNVEDIIESKGLTLNEFLDKLISKDYGRLYPNNHFPTEEMMNEYLATVSNRSDNEIRSILRRFLIHNCSFGLDEFYAKSLIAEKDGKKYIVATTTKTEYKSDYFKSI